jgi:biopolymer transport protein ExbD
MSGGRTDTADEVQLPITPFLDMAFQLMFFFLATFNPPSIKEGQVDLSLASSKEAAPKPELQDPKADPRDERPDIHEDLTINLRGYKDVRNRGLISAVSVTTNAGNEELQGSIEERDNQLRQRLLALRPMGSASRAPMVRLSAESEIRWSQVVQILDICRGAGFSISFSNPPDLGAGAQ